MPFLGQYMYIIGHIFIGRKNKDKAIESMKRAVQKIKSGRNVISFPEGTRSKTGELQMFRRGSFMIAKEGGVDIVPMGITGSRKVLPSGRFGIRPGTITLHIGDAIRMDAHAQKTIEQIAEYTREKVAALIKEK